MTDFVHKKMKGLLLESFIFEKMLSYWSYFTSSNLNAIVYQCVTATR